MKYERKRELRSPRNIKRQILSGCWSRMGTRNNKLFYKTMHPKHKNVDKCY